MRKLFRNLLLVSFLILLTLPAIAQEDMARDNQTEETKAPVLQDYISYLGAEWAHINYEVKDKKAKSAAIKDLNKYATGVIEAFKDSAEPKIWAAIILATDAGITKSLSGLSKLKKARKLLKASLKEDPKALNSSAYTTLGSLYYQVPGWPISFGNDKKAEKFLKIALIDSPDDIDANYFYGDFLLDQKRYGEAIEVLQKALSASDRPNRPVADKGRRGDIKIDIAKVEKKLGR